MTRRIVRTSEYTPPPRTVKSKKLSEKDKWMKSAGKKGEYSWDIIIHEDGEEPISTTIHTDSWDEVIQWAFNKCRPFQTIYVDGQKVVER